MKEFNHEMLVLAREARGLTQSDLSDLVAIGQATLSKFETGLRIPPDAAVSALASGLRFPESFFFQSGRPYGFPPFHYRKRKKLSAKALGRIVAEMNIRRMHVAKLSISYGPSVSIPEFDLDEYQGKSREHPSPSRFAAALREAWMLPDGPIPNMVDLIEDHGGIVIPCDFESTLIDALSQRIDGMPVLFFINKNAPADRVRFTLAHEIGHMSLHTTSLKSDEAMEEEADEFASEFLMPAKEIRHQMRGFDLRQIANLKGYWKVSMASIAYRANSLNLVSPYQYKMFWIEMGKLGYRRREPNEPPVESPTLLRKMVDFHRVKLNYSESDLSELLCLSPEDFQSMYGAGALGLGAQKAHLRLVMN